MRTFLLAVLVSVTEAQTIGYYSWNWGGGSHGPPGANVGVAFTGLVDPARAVAEYTTPPLVGTKYCSLGGGNAAGMFTAQTLPPITAAIKSGVFRSYQGICFDVEIVRGSSGTMIPLFRAAFEAAKAAGLRVMVTTSHSAPYDTDTPADAVNLVKAWVGDRNIDIFSPQLYSSGSESAPDLAETSTCRAAGCTWDVFRNHSFAIAPSIVNAGQYAAARSGLSAHFATAGYVVWAQVH